MFHPYKKNSSYLRAAIFDVFKGKCAYCGRTLQQRDMHIDHIIPSKTKEIFDDEVKQYIMELEESGFVVDSIENYMPSCPACNITKSNQVYTAGNLRFFHETVRVHVKDILQKIDSFENTTETFYEPVNTEIWEELNFSYQRDLSHAIMGYRLTPADVVTCPRFSQVDKIIKQLSIVDYTVIQGENGCGKSISLYQAAFDFYKKGWKIYRYKAIIGTNVNISIPSHNTESALYIIDDAQQLSERVIDELKNQARSNVKILLAKTVSSFVLQDTILLTNKEAVETLSANFESRKEEIIPIVHRCDENIGINFMDQPIERRLQLAKEAKTPWQFNYILRGGWQSMKERYQMICSHNNCDLLVATIATFQILLLDHGVNFNCLCNNLQSLDGSLNWNKNDLQYLIEKMVVLSEDDVRIVHMESAKVIVALFLKGAEEKKKNILFNCVEKSFIEKQFSPLGLVWLCNGLLTYSSIYNIKELFITEKMIVSALECIDIIHSSQERAYIAFFMEKVFNMKYEKNGKYFFDKHQRLLLEWVQSADSKTAYAYSRLINTLHNTDNAQHKEFTQELNWEKLQLSMLSEKNPNLYVWGELYGRLICSFSKQECLYVGKVLVDAIEKICNMATVSNIEELSHFLCSIAYTNPLCIHNAIEKLLPIYAQYFKTNMLEAIYLFDFAFLAYICGMSLLGGHRATDYENQNAIMIVSVLPEREFADAISKCAPRDWHTIYPIMVLIKKYDKAKVRNIVDFVDLSRLTDAVKDSWGYKREISEICEILNMGNSKVAREFIKMNMEKIQVMYSIMVIIAPKYAIDAFDNDVKIDLLTEKWWDVSFYALCELKKVNPIKAKEILTENIPDIIGTFNSITALDFDDRYCLEFIKLIYEIDVEIFKLIVSKLDVKRITNNWSKGAIHSKKKKQVQKRREEFYKIIEKYS